MTFGLLVTFRYNLNYVVQIKLDDPIIPLTEEFIVYKMADFLADFGGYLGLLIGASAFTIYEGFEILLAKFQSREPVKK